MCAVHLMASLYACQTTVALGSLCEGIDTPTYTHTRAHAWIYCSKSALLRTKKLNVWNLTSCNFSGC